MNEHLDHGDDPTTSHVPEVEGDGEPTQVRPSPNGEHENGAGNGELAAGSQPSTTVAKDQPSVGKAVWIGLKDAGSPVVRFLDMVGGHLILTGRALSWLPRRPFRAKNYLDAAEYIGFGSLPIVLLVGFFTGAVMSLQSVAAFRQFGLESFSGGTTGKALSIELGPVLTSLMLAGRAGAGIATELGTMRISEQIDALESMAVNPVQYLVLPRLIAAMIVAPILTLLFFVVGMGGAYLVAVILEHVDQGQWVANLRDIVLPKDVLQGLIKSVFFGFLITLIGCYQGFTAKGGGRGVGMGTTRAVVMGSVTTLVVDYFLSDILLAILGSGKAADVKAVSSGVRVALLFLLVFIGGYLVWKNLGQNPAGRDNYELIAKFRDASGLPKGSRVVVAGLPQGEVTNLEVDGRYAKITFKISSDIKVWESGVVLKKAASLLGDNFLEIDPGEPEKQLSDGTKQKFRQLGPTCDTYYDADEKKAEPCKRVPTVVEATTPDQLLHRIEQTVPKVDTVLESVRDLSEDLRRIVRGPLSNVANRVDGLVQKNSDTVTRIIERADRSMEKIEAIANDLRKITKDADPKIAHILTNVDEASAEAKDLVITAKKELQDTGKSLRSKLDKIDGVIDHTNSIAAKIDEPDRGSLSKLVNDPAIADNVEAITDDARGFLGTLFGLKAYVGLRSEWNFNAALARHYVTVELHTRPDRFYLIELEKGPRGNYPVVTLNFDPTVDPNNWIRKSVIEDKVRFTFQFAKRFGFMTLRYGIKESTGGVGADFDLNWMNRSLGLHLDLFDATFDQLPRIKITAAMEVFRHFYVLGGVDELINNPADLSIVKGTDPNGVPIQFDTFHFGRDYFAGAMLRFNDEDLSALLTVAGSAIGGLAL